MTSFEILPDWATGVASGFLESGAQLCTRDGRRVGNAVVVSCGDNFAVAMTDAGTRMVLTEAELAELFYAPKWIMDVATHPAAKLAAADGRIGDLLFELRAAHQIIRNALNLMTTEQKTAWGMANIRDCVDGEGITRANERAAVIAMAEGKDAAPVFLGEFAPRPQGRPARVVARVALSDVQRAAAVFAEVRRAGRVSAWQRRDIEAAVRAGKSPFIAFATMTPVLIGIDYAREGGAA